MKKRLTKESLARMFNQIIVSFLEFYKKIKDVVSLFKMQVYDVFFCFGSKIFGLQSLRCKQKIK